MKSTMGTPGEARTSQVLNSGLPLAPDLLGRLRVSLRPNKEVRVAVKQTKPATKVARA